MNLLLTFFLAVLFPALHILNTWLFEFANLSTHVSLIYLPAFLRLFNILVMGPLYGTLATFIGGVILLFWFNEPLSLGLMNIVASCAGPLIAMMGFKIYFKRRIQLTSLKDLAIVTVVYAICNSLLHHAIWSILDSKQLIETNSSIWMFVGDLNGALLGAYLLKASLDYLTKKGFNFSEPSQPNN
jgi:hypothetical protein